MVCQYLLNKQVPVQGHLHMPFNRMKDGVDGPPAHWQSMNSSTNKQTNKNEFPIKPSTKGHLQSIGNLHSQLVDLHFINAVTA